MAVGFCTSRLAAALVWSGPALSTRLSLRHSFYAADAALSRDAGLGQGLVWERAYSLLLPGQWGPLL